MEGNGTTRMKGTRMRVEVVMGKDFDEGGEWRIGRIANWVRRRVRPIASGRDKASSRASEGLVGRRVRRGVRV